MPSEHPLVTPADQVPLADDTLQTKRCSACQGPLNADATPAASYPPESSESANFCSACREARFALRIPSYTAIAAVQVPEDTVREQREIDVPRRSLRRGAPLTIHIGTQHTVDSSNGTNVEMLRREKGEYSPDSPSSCLLATPHGVPMPSSALQYTSHAQLEHSPHDVSHSLSSIHQQPYSPTSSFGDNPSPLRNGRDDDYPDPLVDISRLRVRSKSHRSLYPGATFKGSQKSGRNSYDVAVTIVDVDFASSYLCGYLRICGLTEDWPELTTYFDAQIIGMRHGFDTQDWGATRQEDVTHWSRFPAFRAVQKDMIEPRLTLPANTSRPAVFMRWKERFLVPNHRVQDISGASFAGFYYVCVDFEPEPQAPLVLPTSKDIPLRVENGSAPYTAEPQRRDTDSTRRHTNYSREPTEEPAATMCGFYFHQNSEPYQQLSLTHVKDRFRSSFEFR